MLTPPLLVITAALSIVIILDVGLGAYLLAVDRRDRASQIFAAWLACLAAWTLTIVGFYNAASSAAALDWMRVSYVTAIIAVMVFWLFASQYPAPRGLGRRTYAANVGSLALFCLAIMGTDLVVDDVVRTADGWAMVLNPAGWWLYAVYLTYFFAFGHGLLIRSFLRAKGELRRRLLYIITSVFFGIELGGIVCNLILASPVFGEFRLLWLGPLLTSFVVVPFFSFAVYRHRLFALRVIFTQVMVIYATALTVIELSMSKTVTEAAIRGVITACMIIIGIVVVRRTQEDERQRTALEKAKSQADRANAKLSHANAELLAVDRRRDAFITNLSHQLRTPVSVLRGYASLLEEGVYGKLPPDAQGKVTALAVAGRQLSDFIDGALAESNAERQGLLTDLVDVDAVGTVCACVEAAATKVLAKGITLRQVGILDRPVNVRAEAKLLAGALDNVIDNAIRYSQGGEVSVGVAWGAGMKNAVISVADQGIGMTREDAAMAFEKFFRSGNPAVLVQPGVGMGLHTASHLLRRMGGKIWIAKTEPGKGTTVKLRLPAAGQLSNGK